MKSSQWGLIFISSTIWVGLGTIWMVGFIFFNPVFDFFGFWENRFETCSAVGVGRFRMWGGTYLPANICILISRKYNFKIFEIFERKQKLSLSKKTFLEVRVSSCSSFELFEFRVVRVSSSSSFELFEFRVVRVSSSSSFE